MNIRNRATLLAAVAVGMLAPVASFATEAADPLGDMAEAVDFSGVNTLLGVIAVAVAVVLLAIKGVRIGWRLLK